MRLPSAAVAQRRAAWALPKSGYAAEAKLTRLPRVVAHARDTSCAYQKAEIEKWWPIVKEANIKAEW